MEMTIGKTRWYMGMHWNAFDTAPSFSEIRTEADHLGSNRYALRVSELAVQAGFSNGHEPFVKGKSYSLAARLASAVAEPWFGVFDLGGGRFWYIAVRDGYSILPDGDVIGSSEEIDLIRDSHSGFNDWKVVKGDIATLEELLSNIATDESSGAIQRTKLVPVNYITTGIGVQLPWKPIVAGLTATLIVGGGLYWQSLEKEKQDKAAAHQALKVQAQATINRVMAPLATPLPNEWLKACRNELMHQPLAQHAWKLSQVGCAANEAQMQWKLTPGATVKDRPAGVLNADGSQIDQVAPLQLPSLPATISPPGSLHEDLLSLRFIAQATGMDLQLATTADQQGSALPGQTLPSLGKPEALPLPKQGFVLISKTAPFSIDFSSVPGMRITKLTSSLADGDGWKLEGTVYGR